MRDALDDSPPTAAELVAELWRHLPRLPMVEREFVEYARRRLHLSAAREVTPREYLRLLDIHHRRIVEGIGVAGRPVHERGAAVPCEPRRRSNVVCGDGG